MPTDLIVVLGALLVTGTVGAVTAWRLLSHAQRDEAMRRAAESQLELSLKLERAEKEIQGVRKSLAGAVWAAPSRRYITARSRTAAPIGRHAA